MQFRFLFIRTPFLIWRKICNKDAEGLLQAIAFKFKFSRAIDSMSLARSSNTPLTAIVHFRDLAVTFRPRKLCRAESHRPIVDSNDRVEWLWPTSKYRCEYQWSSYLLPFFFPSFLFFFFLFSFHLSTILFFLTSSNERSNLLRDFFIDKMAY